MSLKVVIYGAVLRMSVLRNFRDITFLQHIRYVTTCDITKSFIFNMTV